MPRTIERIELLSLSADGSQVAFPDIKGNEKHLDLWRQGVRIEYEFLLVEFKSDLPPTHLQLKYQFSEENNSVHEKEILFYKNREDFKFENGLYILYCHDMDIFPANKNPMSMRMKNTRDINSRLEIIYIVTITLPE